jgi:DNA modification methylase
MIGGSVISFIDWRQWPNLVGAVESTNLRVNQMLVWDKMSMGMGHGFRSQHELMLHASRGTARVNSKAVGNVFRHTRETPIDHPSPKPVALMRDLLGVVSARGETIVDPFMGSGRTLRAAKDLGRNAIGIETVEKYCEVAARLMQQEALPLGEPAAEQLTIG